MAPMVYGTVADREERHNKQVLHNWTLGCDNDISRQSNPEVNIFTYSGLVLKSRNNNALG